MASAPNFMMDLLRTLKTQGTKRTYSKGQFLLREGEIEKNLYYIESGAIRIFLLSEYEEQCVRFGYEGSALNSLSSFLHSTPSEFYIEAIRKTDVRIISRAHFFEIVHTDADSLGGYRSLLETVIAQQLDREIDLLTASPTERLKRVLKRSPDLFREVPLKYIASYLRMTPETLSRIRNS